MRKVMEAEFLSQILRWHAVTETGLMYHPVDVRGSRFTTRKPCDLFWWHRGCSYAIELKVSRTPTFAVDRIKPHQLNWLLDFHQEGHLSCVLVLFAFKASKRSAVDWGVNPGDEVLRAMGIPAYDIGAAVQLGRSRLDIGDFADLGTELTRVHLEDAPAHSNLGWDLTPLQDEVLNYGDDLESWNFAAMEVS